MPFQDTGQYLLRCGLPGAVGPQEAEYLPVLHREVQTMESLLLFAVGECQVLYFTPISQRLFPDFTPGA